MRGTGTILRQSDLQDSTIRSIPWWLSTIVVVGALLTAAGGILAFVHPETLLESGQPMNQAAHIYANYLVSRNLAMAVALLTMLALRARRMLAGLMVLVAIVQLIDAIGDATTGRASLLPIILVFAIAFLLAASRLFGHPFWHAAAWRDTVGTVDPPP